MSLAFNRLKSSTTPGSAASVALQFLTRTQSLPPRTRTQLLDANQIQRLSATLSRQELSDCVLKDGTPIPACYHLAYFTPGQVEEELGRDGTDTTFNPPHPFTRRMWAGGEVTWVDERRNKLRVGQLVTETTKLLSAEGKTTKAGEEMVVVGVEKSYANEDGLALIDKRNWIFRPEIVTPQAPAPRPAEVKMPEGKHTRDFLQTPVTLFRFSALTFNGHKIHYNREWCQEVEGHRDLVVHGPLNLINMVNFWRDTKGGEVCPRRVTYRATSPLYAGERYRLIMADEADKISALKFVDSFWDNIYDRSDRSALIHPSIHHFKDACVRGGVHLHEESLSFTISRLSELCIWRVHSKVIVATDVFHDASVSTFKG